MEDEDRIFHAGIDSLGLVPAQLLTDVDPGALGGVKVIAMMPLQGRIRSEGGWTRPQRFRKLRLV